MEMLWQFGGGFLIGLFAAILPGPDTVLVVRSVTSRGVRAGIRAALGIGAGLGIHAAITLLLVLVLHDFAGSGLLSTLQIAGGLYLAYLGVNVLKAALKPNQQSPAGDGAVNGFFIQGFVTNLTNPKAIVFFTAVVSQFLSGGNLAGGVAALLGIAVAVPVWFMCLSVFTARVAGRAAVGRQRTIDLVAGSLFLLLAGYGLVSFVI